MNHQSSNHGQLYLGTSGLILPVPNKSFYPEAYQSSSRLCYYSSLMNSIEINSSFYKTPGAATVARWSAEVSEGFKFTFKLLRDISHSKNLNFDPNLLQSFMEAIVPAAQKKACLLVQFPPGLKYDALPQLLRLLTFIQEYNPLEWEVAIEFRHISWYRTETYDLLAEKGATMVFQDKAPAITPFEESWTSFVYLRFHGPNGNYRDSYDEGFLSEYAGYIREWISEGKTVYGYFNNTMGAAYQNLKTLERMVNIHEMD